MVADLHSQSEHAAKFYSKFIDVEKMQALSTVSDILSAMKQFLELFAKRNATAQQVDAAVDKCLELNLRIPDACIKKIVQWRWDAHSGKGEFAEGLQVLVETKVPLDQVQFHCSTIMHASILGKVAKVKPKKEPFAAAMCELHSYLDGLMAQLRSTTATLATSIAAKAEENEYYRLRDIDETSVPPERKAAHERCIAIALAKAQQMQKSAAACDSMRHTLEQLDKSRKLFDVASGRKILPSELADAAEAVNASSTSVDDKRLFLRALAWTPVGRQFLELAKQQIDVNNFNMSQSNKLVGIVSKFEAAEGKTDFGMMNAAFMDLQLCVSNDHIT